VQARESARESKRVRGGGKETSSCESRKGGSKPNFLSPALTLSSQQIQMRRQMGPQVRLQVTGREGGRGRLISD